LDWLLSSLEQVCTSCLPPFSTSEDLYICEIPYSLPDWQDGSDDFEKSQWLGLLRPFTAAKNLYLSEQLAPRIVPALQELVGGRTTEVLPAVENIFLEGLRPLGPVQEGIEKFVAMRQVTGHPIAVTRWERNLEEEEEDYYR